MVIVQIKGGLGNQLFQYAAGKSLAVHNNTELKLDISAYENITENTTYRRFELPYFNIDNICIASHAEINQFKSQHLILKLFEKFLKLRHKRKVYKEGFFCMDTNFFKAISNIYLQGYWQSEKYFIQYEKDIRKSFTIQENFTQHLSIKATLIKNQPCIAVHIRRGDYVQPTLQEYHGLLDASYYKTAINYLLSIIPEAKLYFFSDDPVWVKENIQVQSDFEFISGNLTRNHIEDFYLMSQCKYNIIANSSFSWWAAWLNNNPNKIVIAPKKWFNKANHNTSDLIPNTWIRM